MKKNFIFSTAKHYQLQVSVYAASESLSDKCILGLHGFKGFKDWGFWPFTANYLADAGYTVVLINFSHNGIGDTEDEFTELDKFRNNTFSLEREEAMEILSGLQSGSLLHKKFSTINLLGHSRGGTIGLLAAHHDAVDSLVTLAAVATFDRFTMRQKTEWLEHGFINVINSRTNQSMPLGIGLLNDLTENSDTVLNIKNASGNLSKPWLILHGVTDVTVPIREARTLFSWSDASQTELIEVPQTGHTFEATHPFTQPSRGLLTVLEHAKKFLDKVTR